MKPQLPEETIEAARAAYIGKRIKIAASWLQECFGFTKLSFVVADVIAASASSELYLLIGSTGRQISVFCSDDMTIEIADQ